MKDISLGLAEHDIKVTLCIEDVFVPCLCGRNFSKIFLSQLAFIMKLALHLKVFSFLPMFTYKCIAKLHSKLANPTEPQLDWVGVDFVFPCHNNKNKNPHLVSTRRNGHTCLKSGGIPVGVWRMF